MVQSKKHIFKQFLSVIIAFLFAIMVMPDFNFKVTAAKILLHTVDFKTENDGYTNTNPDKTIPSEFMIQQSCFALATSIPINIIFLPRIFLMLFFFHRFCTSYPCPR